jgi:hypothetical protein
MPSKYGLVCLCGMNPQLRRYGSHLESILGVIVHESETPRIAFPFRLFKKAAFAANFQPIGNRRGPTFAACAPQLPYLC